MRHLEKPLKFTRHAKNRMRWHKITTEEVTNCIVNPDREEPARKGKTHSWQRLGQKFLRVTWLEEESVMMVITAVLKQSLPEEMKK